MKPFRLFFLSLFIISLLCSCRPKMYILEKQSTTDPAIHYHVAYVTRFLGVQACRIDESEDGRIKNPGTTVSKDNAFKFPSWFPSPVAPVTPVP